MARTNTELQPYHALEAAYAELNATALHSVVTTQREAFVEDRNMGLVTQVAQSLFRRKIQRLTKAFVTLSLDDIAASAALPDAAAAERVVRRMVHRQEIFARVDQRKGMVEFLDCVESHDAADTQRHMGDGLQRMRQLHAQMQQLDRQMLLNPRYAHETASRQARRSPSPSDVSMDMDPEFLGVLGGAGVGDLATSAFGSSAMDPDNGQ